MPQASRVTRKWDPSATALPISPVIRAVRAGVGQQGAGPRCAWPSAISERRWPPSAGGSRLPAHGQPGRAGQPACAGRHVRPEDAPGHPSACGRGPARHPGRRSAGRMGSRVHSADTARARTSPNLRVAHARPVSMMSPASIGGRLRALEAGEADFGGTRCAAAVERACDRDQEAKEAVGQRVRETRGAHGAARGGRDDAEEALRSAGESSRERRSSTARRPGPTRWRDGGFSYLQVSGGVSRRLPSAGPSCRPRLPRSAPAGAFGRSPRCRSGPPVGVLRRPPGRSGGRGRS